MFVTARILYISLIQRLDIKHQDSLPIKQAAATKQQWSELFDALIHMIFLGDY